MHNPQHYSRYFPAPSPADATISSAGVLRRRTDWGSPLAGNYKFALLALIAALLLPPASALGQSAQSQPNQVQPPDCAPPDCQPNCCPEDAGDCRPLLRFPDWMRQWPHCSLWDGWSAQTHEVPWANWNASPLSVGAFVGVGSGGALISDWVGTGAGFDGGWRLGWDVTPSWGTEMRFAFASLSLYDSYAAKLAYIEQGNNSLTPPDHRNAELFQWDVDVLYYPWRETRLRPYALAGIGLTDINFTDRLTQSYQAVCLSLPIGIGVKYLCDDNLDLRLDLIDDIAMSNDHLQTQNNLSLTAGMELRFGGSRKVYWPFDLAR
jgi:hypothetical protein